MERFAIIYLFFFCLLNAQAQNIIILKNGETKDVNNIETNDIEMNAKPDDDDRDRTYTLKLSDVKTIHYKTGDVDLLSSRNPRSIFPLGISAVSGIRREDAIMFGGCIDYFLTPNISIELNIGRDLDLVHDGDVPFLYFLLGGKYWFASKKSKNGFSPFTGLSCGYTSRYSISILEIPVGVSYITKFGLQTSLQLSYAYYPRFKEVLPGIEFKLGWRLKARKE